MAMNGRIVRTGVVGTGYLGRLHTRVLTEIDGFDVIGFVERDDAIAGDIETSFSLKRFPDAASLAREVECAVIATPTLAHAEVAEVFLSSGCDVMIEKPITARPEEARRLIDLARENGRIIQVGHVERYNPAIVAVADLVQNCRYIEAQRLGVFVGRSLDIDVLLDLMIHDLNLVLSLGRSDVVSVAAVGVPVLTDKVDIANVRIELENGCVANLTASRVSSERMRKIRFFGHESYVSVDTKEQEVKGYRLAPGDSEMPSIVPLTIDVKKEEPLRAELESFRRCVIDRTAPLVSAEDGLAALELAIVVGQAIERSMARGSRQ